MTYRRWALLVFVALVATGGCGDSASPPEAGGPAATDATQPPPAGGQKTPAPAPAPGGAPSTGTPLPTTGMGNGSTSPSATPPTTAAAARAIAEAARSGVGGFARTVLAPAPATAVVLEVFSQEGAAVSDRALQHAVAVLGQVSHKTATTRTVAVPGGARQWTADDLVQLADGQSRSPQGAGREAVLHVELLHGTYQGDGSVLGIAVRGDVLAVFTDQVQSSATLLVSEAAIEDAVLVHEVGHVLGLVDLVIQTGRADPHYPGHSTNPKSVMYWAVESDLVTQALSGAWLRPNPRRTFPTSHRPEPPLRGEVGGSRYGLAALHAELGDLRRALVGDRNNRLNRAAFCLGMLAAGGELDEALVEDELLAAALDVGLAETEAQGSIRSGLAAGAIEPRRRPGA